MNDTSTLFTDDGIVEKRDIVGDVVIVLCVLISLGLIGLGVMAFIA